MGRLWHCLSPSLLVLCVTCLCLSETREECVYGATDDGECRCSGRLRLENSSGVIVDHFGGGIYKSSLHCLFYLESDRPMSSVRLKFNHFDTECFWDYVYVFSGDSIYSRKLAVLTGELVLAERGSDNTTVDITPIPALDQNETNSTNISSSGMGMGSGEAPVPIPFREPHDLTLVSPGSSLLLYFVTDVGVEKTGFNLSYWLNYTCPENCSGRGDCGEDGKCECVEGWKGEWCQLPGCPNDCFGNGVCSGDECQCEDEFTGLDCSIPVSSPRWQTVNFTTSGNLTEALLARASHSAVLWGDYVIVYGGYRFPSAADSNVDTTGSGSGGGEEEEGEEEGGTGPQLLRYHLLTSVWEELEVNMSAPHPSPRYGHSAVIYNDTMHIFGGVLIPRERTTNEHWALHLPTLTWSPLTLHTDDIIVANSSDNSTDADADVAMETPNRNVVSVPLPVRSHTAHVVGSTMVVLMGMTDSSQTLLNYVQEYDFELGEWSVPSQNGVEPDARTGHSSVYDMQTGLVYVYGGHTLASVRRDLLVYDPVERSWSGRSMGPTKAYLHSAVLLWDSLMLVFGGSDMCFTDQLLVYNIACDEWFETDYLGLPGDARRIGHTSFVDPAHNMLVFGGFLGQPYGDMLRLTTGNCSEYSSEEECSVNVFCGWAPATNSCVSLGAAQSNPNPLCSIDACLSLSSCGSCLEEDNCTWSEDDNSCHAGDSTNVTCPESASPSNSTAEDCERFEGSCQGCLAHGCQWTDGCVAADLNVTANQQCLTPCSALSCSECTTASNCFWCPSLNQCFYGKDHAYTFTYPFGQCLGWYSNSCPENCNDYNNCDNCHGQSGCGWCRDPIDTGLGTCSEGGFSAPRELSSSCPAQDWFFEQCPACQCNGHSVCVNESVCAECQNNTKGEQCQECADDYFGDATGGGTCTECDCNGYDAECNSKTGVCQCYDVGVTGQHCTVCDTNNSYVGDADNICYYKMSVGFIYTFGVTETRERESFYLAVPKDDKKLTFEFNINSNPRNQDVMVQLFLGKVSENYWVLANLTDPIRVTGGGKFTRDLDDMSGNRNISASQLFTFVHPRLRATSNFTDLFYSRTEHDYTNKMWNGDVALIVHVYNLTSPLSYKMTLDQTDLWFLLYFFATFIICFTGLLTAFMVGWYLKRKIEMRRYMRQQYRELRRRVARPFSRIKLIVQNRLPGTKPLEPQNASYISAHTCRTGKAGVLTTFIQLPSGSTSGRPAPGRTSLCLGTALVKITKKGKGKGRGRGRGGGEEAMEIQSTGEGERNGSLRERRVDRSDPSSGVGISDTTFSQ